MLRKSHESATKDVRTPSLICKGCPFCDHDISVMYEVTYNPLKMLWLGFLNLF